jgi:hypothetical protein
MEEREDEVRTYVGGVDDGTCLITRCLVFRPRGLMMCTAPF